jgi:hypothetical protein
LALCVVALVGVTIWRTVDPARALRFAYGAAAWLGLAALLASSGFLAQRGGPPPHFLVLLLPALALPIALGFSRVGDALASLPVALLVGFHGFRLPLELLMHRAAAEGTMPAQMTYTGFNFDIATGVTALLVAGLAARGLAPRWLLLAWNALATLLLLAVLGIAVASLPMFAAFGPEPERLNTWVAYFPFVWLPAGLVSAAVLGHVLLWRRLTSSAMRGRASALLS